MRKQAEVCESRHSLEARLRHAIACARALSFFLSLLRYLRAAAYSNAERAACDSCTPSTGSKKKKNYLYTSDTEVHPHLSVKASSLRPHTLVASALRIHTLVART